MSKISAYSQKRVISLTTIKENPINSMMCRKKI